MERVFEYIMLQEKALQKALNLYKLADLHFSTAQVWTSESTRMKSGGVKVGE